jgi:glutamate-ammonia-ligase adenylyltransferase
LPALAHEVRFRDRARASARLDRLFSVIPQAVQDRLKRLLASSVDPDSAVHYLIRLLEDQPAAFRKAVISAGVLHQLITVFSHSRFLSEGILKTPDWIEGLSQSGDLHRIFTVDDYRALLDSLIPAGPPQAIELAAFRRRQLLRILLRDVLGFGSLSDITEEISNLADAILDCAYRRLRDSLSERHGGPGSGDSAGGLSIIALGKLGGRELNYSSDIDLMFVYSGSGETTGPSRIPVRDFFRRVCVQLTELLSSYTPHGMCYRVDLRLRPEGALGDVCLHLNAAVAYYRQRARDWELQMLIKARIAAGEPAPGQDLLEAAEPLIYSTSLDFSKIEAVSESRVRISEKLAKMKARTEFDIKLAPGGIRDIEFLVQCLQRLHGGRESFVRHGGTQLALFRLHGKDLLSDFEYGRLMAAYRFLRDLEHRLQLVDDRQTHSLPSGEEDMDLLARRMPPSEIGAQPSAVALRQQLDSHLDSVRAIYDRVVHAQLPLHYTMQASAARERAASLPPAVDSPPIPLETVSSNLARLISQTAPGLAVTLSRSRLKYGSRAFEHFLEKVMPAPQWLGWLDQDPVLTGYVIDLFEHSPFFGGQLIRKPEWIEELYEMRRRPPSKSKYAGVPATLADPADLRRFFNREMMRLQAESICLQTPVFDTLKQTSDLADCAIRTAYQMAVNEVYDALPPPSGYLPQDQMVVIALGRLGMQELDLGSDADLIFVLPDRDSAELPFWTKAAEKTVDLLSAYTGDGTLFAVDTRLRPNGGAGPLVQTESAFKEYFLRQAQAWEGITYMKSRAVAGDHDWGTRFLEGLQDVDWRRYGQGGRSRKELRQMRLRLENEQGKQNPLKAGRGGFYDIDFALMYLRLKGAGIFFPVLNTPERISVVEKMGHLDRADARFLLDAATFYRAVDHALRLNSGHAEGHLPASRLQLDMVSELVSRWTPDHLHDQPLPVELSQIQNRTREYFDRLFNA